MEKKKISRIEKVLTTFSIFKKIFPKVEGLHTLIGPIYYIHTQTQWNIQNAAANALCQHHGVEDQMSVQSSNTLMS